MDLEPIEFEPPAEGHCCALCNPYSVADYETRCVAVRRRGGNRVYVCTPCVQQLGRTMRRRETLTNAEDLARWGRLSVRGAERLRQRSKR